MDSQFDSIFGDDDENDENLPEQRPDASDMFVPVGSRFRPESPTAFDDDAIQKAVACTTQSVLMNGDAPANAAFGELLEPRNEFEQFLSEQCACDLRTHEDDVFFYLNVDGNHAMFVDRLRGKFANQQRRVSVLNSLLEALNDRTCLTTYLMPTQSSFGQQDTIFRALLLVPQIQTQVFERLMNLLANFATESDEASVKLAMICVAHARYLDIVVAPLSLARMILEQDFTDWNPQIRDELITALPEMLPDEACHAEVALQLQEWMLTKNERLACFAFRNALLSTLLLLRLNLETTETICKILLTNCDQFDAASISQLVGFALSYAQLKKNGFYEVLLLMRKYIKVDRLKVDRSNANGLTLAEAVNEMFAKFLPFMVILGESGWKQLGTFFTNSKSSTSNDNEEEGENDEDLDGSGHDKEAEPLTLFELLLAFTVLGEESCPEAVEQRISREVCVPENLQSIKSLVQQALNFKKFTTTHRTRLLNFAEQLMWSKEAAVKELAGHIYAEVLRSASSGYIGEILGSLISHMGGSALEASACLTALEYLVDVALYILKPYTDLIKGILQYLETFTTDNAMRVFRLFVNMSTKDAKLDELKTTVNEFIVRCSFSATRRMKLWAAGGLITLFETALTSKNAQNREKHLSQQLESLSRLARKDDLLEAVSCRLLTAVLHKSTNADPSDVVIAWANDTLTAIKREFFAPRATQRIAENPLEAQQYLSDSNLWLNITSTNACRFVSMLLLIEQQIRLLEKWRQPDDRRTSAALFDDIAFVWEANVAVPEFDDDDNDEKSVSERASMYFALCKTLTAILNLFANLAAQKPDVLAVLHKKCLLFEACQRKWRQSLSQLSKWYVPADDVDGTNYVVVMRNTETRKRPTTSSAKKSKRKKTTPDQADPDADANEGNEAEPVLSDEGEQLEISSASAGHTTLKVRNLDALFQPLKLSLLVSLLRAFEMGAALRNLCLTQMAEIVHVILARRERSAFWLEGKATENLRSFHGEPAVIWKLCLKAMPSIVTILYEIRQYFKAEADDVAAQRPALWQLHADMELAALRTIRNLFQYKEAQANVNYGEKRDQLLQEIDAGAINRFGAENSQGKLGALACEVIVQLCEVCPTLEVASVLSEIAKLLITEASDEQRRKFALAMLGFLKYEWTNEDFTPVAQSALTSATSTILLNYFALRERDDRLKALEWLVFIKIAAQTSKANADKAVCKDDFLTEEYKTASYYCITKKTFAQVYRTALTVLNECVSDSWAKDSSLDARSASPGTIMDRWLQAASIFAALAAVLQYKPLRTSHVLTAFARHGRKFALTFAKKSSFLVIFAKHLSTVSEKAHKTIHFMQIGVRHFEQVAVYAKENRDSSLLRQLPDLRSCSEIFLRTIQSLVTNAGCLDAVEFGIIHARNIDGERIEEEDSEAEDATADNDAPENTEQEEQDTEARADDRSTNQSTIL